MVAQSPLKKIGLIGPFGYGNLGDAAIQEAMIQHIRMHMPGAEIVGFSLNPEDTKSRHGISSYPISHMSWKEDEDGDKSGRLDRRLARQLRASSNPALRNLGRWVSRIPIELGLWVQAFHNLKDIDALIVSGGGQLDDYWGGGGPWSHPYTLLKWGLLTRLRKGKFIFASVGAGPIDARLSQLFIRYALGLASYRSYRDQYSKDLIHKIGFHKDDPVYPDLAHSLMITQTNGNGHQTARRLVVGVGPIGYFKKECWPEHDKVIYSNYLAKMTNFVSWLVEQGHAIVFLPGEAYYDQLAIDDLKKALEESGVMYQDDQLIQTPICTLDDLINALLKTDMIVGSRFHTVLLAQLLEKPVLAISYQAKIDSLMMDTGQGEFCIPIHTFEADQIIKLFGRLENSRALVKQQLVERARRYTKALERQYERIFAEF